MHRAGPKIITALAPNSVAHHVGEGHAEGEDADGELEDEERLLLGLHVAIRRAGGLLRFRFHALLL